jgi:hypothetical protein
MESVGKKPRKRRWFTPEPQAARGRGRPDAGDGFLRERDPVSVYPFIEAEQAQ